MKIAAELLGTLHRDRRDHLLGLDDYATGNHPDPYVPDTAGDEYKLLVTRAVTNLMPLLESTPAQSLYVDSFRRSAELETATNADLPAPLQKTPEMAHWERSRLGAKQVSIHRGALRFGHSFCVTERGKSGFAETRGLSALKTVALYEDPANDMAPYAAITITKWPAQGDPDAVGRAIMWDDRYRYNVTFKGLSDKTSVQVAAGTKHGASECPVTRFAACVDLEGRTTGVIEPLIALQNRINQTVFDLLIAQTQVSTEARWATGIAPPVERDPQTGEPILDERGQQKPIPMNFNAARIMFAPDKDARFGSLPASPLDGLLTSISVAIQNFSALSQTPPHYLLGQIANLSADALIAAELSLQRKVKEFQQVFGESWERVFRIAAEIDGADIENDFDGEVIWRDVEGKSIAQAADALGKLADQLGIPVQGLWKRVPDVTAQELAEWTSLAKEQDGALALAGALNRATPPSAATAGRSTTSGDSIETAKEVAAA